jgi:hypothetical protein
MEEFLSAGHPNPSADSVLWVRPELGIGCANCVPRGVSSSSTFGAPAGGACGETPNLFA